MFNHKNNKLIYFLSLIWLSHFIQVLVPETGFDAIWYHLPVADSIIKHGKIVFSPELYQSLNPLFSDLFFIFGYFLLGSTGTKIIAFIFAIFLMIATYKLSRIFLSSRLSFGVVSLVSTFQVVSWQSSSFYVDVAKAFWEILAIYFILKSIDSDKTSEKLKASLAFGASLATKLFSVFLLPVYYLIVAKIFSLNKKSSSFKSRLQLILILLLPLSLPAYFYINSYLITGNPFYSFSIHLNKLSEIGGKANFVEYLLSRSLYLPSSPIKIIFVRDYVSPLIPLLLIPVLFKIKKIIKDKKLFVLFIFSMSQWLLWWYLPPLSTRYALSGFIALFILEISVLKRYFSTKITEKKILVVLVIFATLNFTPRLLVNYRSLRFLFGNQTERQYIEQFYDGSIDQKLKNWYGF